MAQRKIFSTKKNLRDWISILSDLKNGLLEPWRHSTSSLVRQIWEVSENRAKAIYRMLGNANFDREEIIRAHREAHTANS
jgi:hypothetical protein